MISVLIPIYNYKIQPLVYAIHRQFSDRDTAYEIICFEDGSDKNYVEANAKIKELPNTSLLVSDANFGRTKARQKLSDAAKHDWLLFLDADVMPKKSAFISNYLDEIKHNIDVIFGGICYNKNKPEKEYMLRWKYGTLHEEISANKRQLNPYKLIASANMLIRKDIFNSINTTIKYAQYGMDNYFGAKLKEKNSNVKHIYNAVYHLGIEKSSLYISKKEEAADTLLLLLDEHLISVSDNKLLLVFTTLKRNKFNYLLSFLFKVFKSSIRKNLLSKNPSIKLLQFYRIGYMCYRDLNPNK